MQILDCGEKIELLVHQLRIFALRLAKCKLYVNFGNHDCWENFLDSKLLFVGLNRRALVHALVHRSVKL